MGINRESVQGIFLKHIDGQSSAIQVKANFHNGADDWTRDELNPPKSGWGDVTWNQLAGGGNREIT